LASRAFICTRDHFCRSNLGAEISEIDLSQPLPPGDIATIEDVSGRDLS
jgi:hypothetical protein